MAAYGAITRVDGPDARWIYQGYALTIGGNLGRVFIITLCLPRRLPVRAPLG
jgi:hypothetical protein